MYQKIVVSLSPPLANHPPGRLRARWAPVGGPSRTRSANQKGRLDGGRKGEAVERFGRKWGVERRLGVRVMASASSVNVGGMRQYCVVCLDRGGYEVLVHVWAWDVEDAKRVALGCSGITAVRYVV